MTRDMDTYLSLPELERMRVRLVAAAAVLEGTERPARRLVPHDWTGRRAGFGEAPAPGPSSPPEED